MNPTDRDATQPAEAGVAPEATLAVADQFALDDVLDRLWLLAGETVRLAVPSGSSLFLTAAEFRQLRDIANHQSIALTLETEDPLRVQLAGMFGLPAVRVGGPLGPRPFPPGPPENTAPYGRNDVNAGGLDDGGPESANGHALDAPPNKPIAEGTGPPAVGERELTGNAESHEGGPRFREVGQTFTLRPAEDRAVIEFPTRAPAPPALPDPPKPPPQPVVAPPPVERQVVNRSAAPVVTASGAGAGRFAALRAAAERRAARQRGQQGLGRPATLVLAAAAVTCVLGFAVLFLVLPSATVTIQLREQTVVAEMSFLVVPPDEEVEPNVPAVAGEEQVAELSYTATVETTGLVKVGDRPARGSIQLVNPNDRSVTIDAGAIGVGDTGLQFRFLVAVDVPSSADGGGPVDAEIEMVTLGVAGNLGQGELSGRLDSGVYFSNRMSALTGGTDVDGRGVAPSDLDALIDRYERDRQGLAAAQFAEILPAGMAVAGSSFAFSDPDIQFDHAAGDAAETVTMTLTQAVTGLVYDEDAVLAMARPMLAAELQRQIHDDYALNDDDLFFSIPVSSDQPSESPASIIVTATGRAVIQFDEIDREELVSRLAGEGAGDADDILSASPAVESYSVDYFPGLLVDRMPSRTSRINLVVRE